MSGSQVPDEVLIVTAVALTIWPYAQGLTTVFFSTSDTPVPPGPTTALLLSATHWHSP